MRQSCADSLIVLDFETTGLSPNVGDRAIEIGAVRLEKGEVVERFQALMNPGKPVSGFIENYTGITNRMLSKAAPCDEVMVCQRRTMSMPLFSCPMFPCLIGQCSHG